MDKRIDNIEEKLDDLILNTGHIVEAWDSAKGFIQVIGWFGFVAKWVVTVGVTIAAGWAFIRAGIHK